MNKLKILEVASAIESHAKARSGLHGLIGFNMSHWVDVPPDARRGYKDHIDNCGTTACIAGWTCLLNQPVEVVKEAHESEWEEDTRNDLTRLVDTHQAAAILGLTHDEALRLFMAHGSNVPMSKITAEQAVSVLRLIAEWDGTGALEEVIVRAWEDVTYKEEYVYV